MLDSPRHKTELSRIKQKKKIDCKHFAHNLPGTSINSHVFKILQHMLERENWKQD